MWGQRTDGSRKRSGRGSLRNGGVPRAKCYRFGGRTVQVLGVAQAAKPGPTIADGWAPVEKLRRVGVPHAS
uniref:Uncharacterized protein n=1 Tax=Peronospora matthiolae TaxID=2874970 RepID=A0AAV1UUJ4_9STRA